MEKGEGENPKQAGLKPMNSEIMTCVAISNETLNQLSLPEAPATQASQGIPVLKTALQVYGFLYSLQ